MPRKAELYEAAKGRPLAGYFLLKAEGKNMPLSFSLNAQPSPGETDTNL